MSKAEEFIKNHTNNQANISIKISNGEIQSNCIPWVTSEQARKAVEIAREEIINKVVLHIIHNTRTVHYNNYDTREFNKSSLDDIINDLKQAMKDE